MKDPLKHTPSVNKPAASHVVNKHYDSQALFHGQQEILINHAGHAYRLRITRQDKLILTK